MDKFTEVRAKELKYHEAFYMENDLFASGTWLAKPVQSVMELLGLLDCGPLRILDLGCGVGRNSIPIAQKIKEHQGTVTCVDVLPAAIDLLTENARKYDVQAQITAEVADAESFLIEVEEFDIEANLAAEGRIELNLSSDTAFLMLEELYQDWEVLLKKSLPQSINEKKQGKDIEFRSHWITFAARKRDIG